MYTLEINWSDDWNLMNTTVFKIAMKTTTMTDTITYITKETTWSQDEPKKNTMKRRILVVLKNLRDCDCDQDDKNTLLPCFSYIDRLDLLTWISFGWYHCPHAHNVCTVSMTWWCMVLDVVSNGLLVVVDEWQEKAGLLREEKQETDGSWTRNSRFFLREKSSLQTNSQTE